MSNYKRVPALESLIREMRKLGYDKTAELSGIHYGTIVQWCNHKNYPTFDKIDRVAEALGFEFRLVKKETSYDLDQ